MIRFSFFTGDLDFLSYGGKWLSNEQESPDGEKFFFGIRLDNWDDVSEEPGPNGETYNLSLVIIPHPLQVSQDRLRDALKSCDFSEEPSIEMMVDALWTYGVSCPIEGVNTNNWREGMHQLRKIARELDYEEAMERSVNKIGSTGREYMNGDFGSAIVRGLQKGRKDAWLMAQISGAKEEELEAEGFRNPFRAQDQSCRGERR